MAQYHRFYIHICGSIVCCSPDPALYQRYVPAYRPFRFDYGNKQCRAGFRGTRSFRKFRFCGNSCKTVTLPCHDRRTVGIIYDPYSFHAVILEKIKKIEKNFLSSFLHEKTKKKIDKIPEYEEVAIKKSLKRTFFAVHYVS